MVTVDPMLVAGGSGGVGRGTVSGYRLRAGSPAIDCGKVIGENGGRDYWGHPVSVEIAPNRGADNESGTPDDVIYIAPVADAVVVSGEYWDYVFGAAPEASAAVYGSGEQRETFFRFDVGGLAHAGSAFLRIVPTDVHGVGMATLPSIEFVPDDLWSEGTITWKNKPSGSGDAVGGLGSVTVGEAFIIDVTSLVRAEAVGDGQLSLRVALTMEDDLDEGFNFAAREYLALCDRPVLQVTTVAVPQAPANLQGAAGSASIQLTWNSSLDASSYTVKRASSAGGPYETIASGLTGTNYVNYQLGGDLALFYSIVSGPLPVSGLKVGATGSEIRLEWNLDPNSKVLGIRRALNPEGPWITISDSVYQNHYIDQLIQHGKTYFYVVTAVDPAGESGLSGEATVAF
jgi:hypothetical protein